MSGKFITLPVYAIIRGGGLNWGTGKPYPYTLHKFDDNDQNTYITIFSVKQASLFNKFKEMFKGNILFISKPSVNGRANHGTEPRNTVVVYEPVSSV
jgi:hypothetical protein